MTIFVMDKPTAERLEGLARYSEQHPIDLDEMMRRHAAFIAGERMDRPNASHELVLPFGFKVVFTVEQHPQGWMRHMSMSSPVSGRAPIDHALAWVMGNLGYTTPIKDCMVYFEDIGPEHVAINVLEPITTDLIQGRA